jgi:hypothetical protein
MADATSAADRSRAPRAPLAFARVVVIGGGCYGGWYLQQLTRAIARSALMVQEIVIVDHDPDCAVAEKLRGGAYAGVPVRVETREWSDYLADWLAAGTQALERDAMVPSPLMPHLCLEWLMHRARERWPERRLQVEPLAAVPRTPWQRAAEDARHYVSFATWMCPINCIEPATCPETRGPRDWSMPVAMHAFAAQEPSIDRAVIFPCTHRTYGVGMIDAADIARADEQLAAWGAEGPVRVLVGTVSHCHGALGLLTLA